MYIYVWCSLELELNWLALHLQLCVLDCYCSFNDGFVFYSFDGGPCEVDFVVDDEQGVVIFENIVVEGDSVEILFE